MEKLERQAKQGSPKAQFELGLKYADGKDVVQDYSKAAFWWEKAAQQGHATAQYNIAQCYEKELGVNIDYTLALYWYKKAAEQGDDDALTNIALYHYLGRGTCQNYEEAIRLWKEAANLGNNKAAYNLGICYRDGIGALKDLVKAEYWLVKAKDLGHPNASKALEQVQRNNSKGKYVVTNDTLDLVLKSTHHQRYQDGVPVMGPQFCNRMIKVENKMFKELLDGMDVIPEKGFYVTMWNTDMESLTQHMQPKLMEMKADFGDKILLHGVTLKAMGVVVYDNKDYGITLYLENRSVVKCVLHLFDRGVDIEYDEFIK